MRKVNIMKNEFGAASMLTIIFLALVMTIVTISYVRLSVSEQRQATDDDLSTRAFYAAESGIEDGKRALQAYLNNPSATNFDDLNGEECKPPENAGLSPALDPDGNEIVEVSVDPNLDAAYTCHLIDTSPGDVQGELTAWGESLYVPLRVAPGDNYDRIIISWHINGTDSPISFSNNNGKDLPQSSSWGLPAMLRTRIFSTPVGGFGRNNIEDQMGFLNPASSTEATNLVSLNRQIRNATCDDSTSGYACSITITGINDVRNNYLRIQALYNDTFVRVQLYNGSTPVDFDDVQAVIDVTGRANDVYQRLEARVSLTVTDTFQLPDYALLSGEDICKNFLVTDDPGDFVALNPGLAANINSSCRNP